MKKVFKTILSVISAVSLIFSCGCKKEKSQEAYSAEDFVVTEEMEKLAEYLPSDWTLGEMEFIRRVKKDKFTFAVQSDTHLSSEFNDDEYGYNMCALAQYTESAFFANLGDLIRGYADETVDTTENMRKYMDSLTERYIENSTCPVLMTIGNHDANHMWCKKYADHTQLITEKEHYSRVIEPLKQHNGDKMVLNGESTYYYMDFDEYDIRVIMLNSTDGEFTTGYSTTFNFSEDQVDWFEFDALDTDKQVIVMTHTPLPDDPEFTSNKCTNREKILKAVNKFVNKGGRFIAYMYGHEHVQKSYVDSDGRLHICFRNSRKCAEVVMVDTDKRTITTVGFGCNDRNFTY